MKISLQEAYAELNLTVGATVETIRSSYKKLALEVPFPFSLSFSKKVMTFS